jgi:EF hand
MAIHPPMIKRVAAVILIFAAATPCDAQEQKRDQSKPGDGKKASALKKRAHEDPGTAAASMLESAFQGERPPEAARMLAAILRGSDMGPGEGWFGPAESRYTWKWLARRCGVEPDGMGGIPRSKFPGSDALFARLDRDKDGVITPEDLDWSDRNPYVQMSNTVNRFFRRLNTKGDGQLTRDELLQFFKDASHGQNHLSADDFRDALLAGWGRRGKPSDRPTPAILIRGLFAGEIGSMNEGPKVNWLAPDFTLKTVEGDRTIQLSKLIGPKPVVLIFGSFT